MIEGYDCSDLSACPSGYGGPNRCSTELTWLTNEKGKFASYSAWTTEGNSVKTSFVNNENLFNLTYSCRLGNGSYNSGDGVKYCGRGFIQLTGKSKYDELSGLWNEQFPDEQKDFAGADYTSVGTDVRVAMLVSLLEWKRLIDDPNRDYFKNAFEGEWNEKNIKLVGRGVNGSGQDVKSNGEDDRVKKSKKAYENL